MTDIASRPMGTLTAADIGAELHRRTAALIAAGMEATAAISKAGADFRADRDRAVQAEIDNLERWLKGDR